VLVSQPFLDSAYCTDVEIANFLQESRDSELLIAAVILSPCVAWIVFNEWYYWIGVFAIGLPWPCWRGAGDADSRFGRNCGRRVTEGLRCSPPRASSRSRIFSTR